MRSRGLLTAVIIVAGCVAAVAVLLMARSARQSPSQDSAAQKSQAPSTPPATGSPSQAQQVAGSLQKLATDPAALVPAAASPELKIAAAQAFPPGSKIEPLPQSWRPDGVGGGLMTVTVTVPGHAATRYAAVMTQEGGLWKVLATIKLSPADTVPSSGTPTAKSS